MKSLIALMLFNICSYAYTPTVESLFRNGDNDNVDGHTISANFVLTRKNSVEQVENQDGENTLQELPSVFAYKMLFNNTKNNLQLVQISYNGNIISKSSMFDLKYFPQLNFGALKLTGEDVEKRLFYSLMNSLVNNQGNLMIDFLNTVGLSALKNVERVNRDQVQLIGRYINYLKQKKDEPDVEIENPLDPLTPEAKEKVNEIIKSPFLTNSPYVRRVKEGGKIFFLVENENVKIKFDGQKHELINIFIKTSAGEVEVKCFNYVVFTKINKTLKFPQLILLKDLQGNEYELKMEKLRAVNENLDKFLKRLKRYKEDMQKGLNQEILGKSVFVL